MSDLITRAWNGTPIARRTTDGFVNATAMCRANGKEWKHYFETDRCHKYLDALEGSVVIPTDRLFTSITTGPNDGRGTWVHPQVAVDLARTGELEVTTFCSYPGGCLIFRQPLDGGRGIGGCPLFGQPRRL
jgi:hypothetical protein